MTKTAHDGSLNRFEKDKRETPERSRSEAGIEDLRLQGGVFVQAVRATRMPMAMTDPNLSGNPIVFANQSFLDLTGYSMEEVLGQQPFFMNGPDTDAEDAARFREALEQDRDEHLETIQYRKDGSRFIASLFLSAFKDEEGRTLHQFLSWQDVTRQVDAEDDAARLRKAQTALSESEARLARALEAGGLGAWELDLATLEAWRSLQHDRIFGYAALLPEWTYDMFLDHVVPEDRSSVDALFLEAIATGGHWDFECRIRRADGELRWIWAQGRVDPHPEGRAGRMKGMVRDVTERKLSQLALRERDEKYRTLFESIDEGYCIVEVIERSEGRAPDYRILEVNQAFERQTGLTNVAGKLGSEVSGGTEDHWADTYEKVVRTGEPVRVERHHGGTGRWYDVFMTRVGGPESRLVCMIFQDTTERRQREERQRFLLALGDAMRAQSSSEAIVDVAARLLGERLNPSRVLFAEFDEAKGIVTIFHAWLADGAQPFPTVVRQEDFAGPILDDLRAGRTLRVDDAGDAPVARPDLAALAEVGIQAALSVPLIIGGRLMATLSVHQHAARRWTDEEVSLLQEVAERLWADLVRARAQAALRESEERLRRVLETETVAVLFFDAEGTLVDANDAFRRLLGYSRKKVESRTLTWQRLTPPEWHAVSEEQLQKMQAVGRFGPYEKEYLRADGSKLPMLFAGRDLGDGTIVEFGIDITPQKRAEAALRESEERYRLIVENARDYAIIITDPDDMIIDWLPGAEAVFGWTREEAVGRPGDIIFTPEDQAKGEPEREVETAAREGFAPDVRWHKRKDGRQVFIDGSVAPLRNQDGSIRAFLKIGQDVTERRHAQELLETSERRMRSLVTGIPQLVFRSWDDGFRVWGSPQWIEYAGLSFEESLGHGWLKALHPEDRERTLAAWEKVEERGEYYVEHRICHAGSGGYRWHQTRATPLRDPDGRIVEWLGTSTDVEELRQLQRHTQMLLAELQHRVRNTLGVVRSITRRTASTSETVDEMAMHLEGRIGAFSRVQAAVTRNPEAGVDLAALVREELLAHAARDGEHLSIDGPELSFQPRAAESFSLAIHELATNSVKYGALSAEGGRLKVRWDRKRSGEGDLLDLVWEEIGLDLPEGEPQRKGFGMELLERTLPYELEAQTQVEFTRGGLRFRMTMPLTDDVLA